MEAAKKERPGVICIDYNLLGEEGQRHLHGEIKHLNELDPSKLSEAGQRHLKEVIDATATLIRQGFTVQEVDAADIEAIRKILNPLTENRHKVQILCGHSARGPIPYQEDIKAVAGGIAEHGDLLLTPGSNSGLMKIIADEAIAKGGDVIGISSSQVANSDFEPVHPGLSAVIIAPNEDERTAWYGRLANHIVVGPGGVGSVADMLKEIYGRYIDDMYRAETKNVPYDRSK